MNGGGGWGIFNAVLGWQNSATYGSVISYNLYWLVVICGFLAMRYNEVKGHWPLMKAKTPTAAAVAESDRQSNSSGVLETNNEKTHVVRTAPARSISQ